MDKNRAVVALIVIVFVIVVAMLYVIFASDRKNTPEAEETQTSEEGYTFDIDNEIDNHIQEEEGDMIIEATTTKEDKDVKLSSEVLVTSGDSPETGPGFVVAMVALALGSISAGVVYKKQPKVQ